VRRAPVNGSKPSFEARDGLENAEAGLSKLFPYFFPKKEEPKTFTALAKSFNVPEDLGLKLRQEGLKIGVEGTIALVANGQQNVDWTKVGDIGEMVKEICPRGNNKVVIIYIFMFMINVYISCYNCINRNISTCVICRQQEVPSMPLKLAC
jgi:hypothetical protein